MNEFDQKFGTDGFFNGSGFARSSGLAAANTPVGMQKFGHNNRVSGRDAIKQATANAIKNNRPSDIGKVSQDYYGHQAQGYDQQGAFGNNDLFGGSFGGFGGGFGGFGGGFSSAFGN